MIRLSLRIIIGCLLAVIVWWVGPLLSIGIYKPFGWLLLRQVLTGLILFWTFWPLIVYLWGALSMGARRVRPAPRISKQESMDSLLRRLRDLDGYLRDLWLKNRTGWRVRWQLRRQAPHRTVNPWFMVLGAAGSGKTTLIRRGGIALKGSADLVGPDGSEDGHTVDCNFWHAGNAIWFDVNGQWMEPGGADAHAGLDEWRSLLSGLRGYGRRPALDGVLLCVDGDWLLKSSAEGRKRSADAMRARLVDLTETMMLRLPVYLAITGLDRIPGAVAFLGALDDSMLEQGIGFGLPVAETGPNIGAQVGAQLEEAMQSMEQRVQALLLRLAPSAMDPAINHERLMFVENMSGLRRHLADYLGRTALEATIAPSISLRGVWLGSSVDLVDSATPTMLEDDGALIEDGAVRRLASLWIPALRQMGHEQGLSVESRPAATRVRIWTQARYALTGLALLILLSILGLGYVAESANLVAVWERFNEGKRIAAAQSREARPAAALVDVMTQLRYANYNVESTSGAGLTPFWEHVRVTDAAQGTYRRQLRKTVMPVVYNYVMEQLKAELQGAPGDVYETLKISLMMARPERRDANELIQWMRPRWQSLANEGYAPDDLQEYEANLRALFSTAGIPGTPVDENLLREARTKASQIPSVTRVIARVERDGLPANIENISLSTAGGFMAATMLRMRSDLSPTDIAISGWYTRAGYQDAFKPKLRDAASATLQEESWVLRDQSLNKNPFEVDKAVEELADAAQAQYLQDYIRHWQAFLNDVTIRRYSGMDDAAQIASAFIDPQSSLAQFVRFVGRETSLTGNYEGDIGSWIDKQKYNLERSRRAVVGEVSGNHTRFQLTPEHVVDDHFQTIRSLAVQVNQSATSGTGNNPLARLFEPIYRQLSLVNGAMLSGELLPQYDAFTRLRAEAARQPEPLRGIVMDLIESGSRTSVKDARALISGGAAGVVRDSCNRGLTAHYPFNRAAQTVIGVGDYERLFGPHGSMASYFQEHLVNYVDTSSSPWRSKRVDGQQNLVTPDVLRSYEAAQRIGLATMDEQGHLRISTMVRVIDMDPQIGEVQLDIGDIGIRYAHGTATGKRVDWNANAGSSGKLYARITVRTVDGRTDVKQFDGPWALFKFYDSGRQEGSDPDVRQTVHQTGLGAVRVEWQALTTPAPLWSNMLSSFSCPK
ncbi:MAG TPA: type VI secretion system membrane subunit TssM [Burkholderiaceae bacterium]|jgi:type VI secretion system protein ImpL